jgi:hypothetical protein
VIDPLERRKERGLPDKPDHVGLLDRNRPPAGEMNIAPTNLLGSKAVARSAWLGGRGAIHSPERPSKPTEKTARRRGHVGGTSLVPRR